MSGAATVQLTAHARSGPNAGSSGDASSLCAMATRRWRSSRVVCFSGAFSGAAGFSCGARASCEDMTEAARAEWVAPLVTAMKHNKKPAKAGFRRRSLTDGSDPFFLVFAAFAGRTDKFRELALLLLFQQSVE